MATPTATRRAPATLPRRARAPLEPVGLGLVEGAELLGVFGAELVVPKPVGEETAGLVEIGFDDTDDPDPVTDADLLALDADLEDERGTPVTVVDWVAETAPMEKEALVANTALMSEMSTNWMV